jgi:S-DNA-T family DNA segregation ATPase FtsK/SpoIIIE
MARKANDYKEKQENGKEETPVKKTRKKKEPKAPSRFLKDGRLIRITGIFLMFLSVYLVFAFISYLFTWREDSNLVDGADLGFILGERVQVSNWTGKIGAILANLFIQRGVGIAAFLPVAWLFLVSLRMLTGSAFFPLIRTTNITAVITLWLSATLGFSYHSNPDLAILGGSFGYQATEFLGTMLGTPGTIIVLIFIILSLGIVVGLIPWKKKAAEAGDAEGADDEDAGAIGGMRPEDKYNTYEFAVDEADESIKRKNRWENEEEEKPLPDQKPVTPLHQGNDIELTIEKRAVESPSGQQGTVYGSLDSEYDPTLDLPHYKYPDLDLLNDIPTGQVSVAKEELEQNKDRIVETLNNYNIRIDKIKATIGPTVTLYEIIPAAGIRISKIKNLEDDIALSLSAMGIRIIAPIPGKGTIGIEVPNMKPEIVPIKSLLASEKFRNSTAELPFALGKTIANESFIADLTKMPHILMAGATGQGKSVGLNAIMLSLLYKKHPSQIKFVLIDPKKVELTLFTKIERHFLAKLPDSEEAIITDTRSVVRTLNSLGIEMDHRYQLLKDAQVRNIKEYNTKFIARKLNPNEGHDYLPYIIVVIDEFADLIMTAGREIENPLTRLAQLARATGIHLVIATQRPSVNIITGTIKANFPARIAYRVISKVDSRTILDSSGADQLVGRGDMLLSTGNDLIRLQCAFVDTPEVERVTEFIGSQRAYPDAFSLPEYYDEESGAKEDFDPNSRDELFEDAARIIVQSQQGSTSLLQRKLKLGYNRAGRIIDQLEAAGIVGPFEGSKAREVRIANEMALEQFLRDLNSKQ